MKRESPRQTRAEQTDRPTDIVLPIAPFGAKNVSQMSQQPKTHQSVTFLRAPCSFHLFIAIEIFQISKFVLSTHKHRLPEVLGEGPALCVLHGVHPDLGVGELCRHPHPSSGQTRLGTMNNHALEY